MTTQLDLFAPPPLSPGQQTEHDLRRKAEADRREGERRKQAGMALAATSNEHLLARAREYAFDIARGLEPRADGKLSSEGLCTADDVSGAWERDNDRREQQGLPRVPWIGNAAGHIFQERDGEERLWEQVGMVKSCRAHAHNNLLRLWKRKHN